MPSYFQLVLGAVSFFNTLGKGGFKYDKNYNEGGRGCSGRPKQESSYEDSKCNHIFCDEGSKGSNPATPTKATDNQWLFLFSDTFRTNYI